MPLLETKGAGSAQGFGLSLGGEEAVYIEDVFSTYLYTGTGAAQTIINEIDLAGEGGLVWGKHREFAVDHAWYDTERGINQRIGSSTTQAETTIANTITSFNSDGVTLGTGNSLNESGRKIALWTFRKQPKFFDIVTYTGTGTDPLTLSHNLQSVPGVIIIKCTSAVSNWRVHSAAVNASLVLNLTNAGFSPDGLIKNLTSTTFQVNNSADVNSSGATYVAYLFAHDAGGFGLTGLDNVISCGSYTGNGSATGPVITLGWEPQWVLIKNASDAQNWYLLDNMRGMPVGSADANLIPNTSNAESDSTVLSPTATGFQLDTAGSPNQSGNTFIYIAIRRGPMKVPTSGTQVFEPQTWTGTGTDSRVFTGFNFPLDLLMLGSRDAVQFASYWLTDRLQGASQHLQTASTSAVFNTVNYYTSALDRMNGYVGGLLDNNQINTSGALRVQYGFQRAPGFFDVVCYTGTGSNITLNHNLGVAPEFVISKIRSSDPGAPLNYWLTGNNFTSTTFDRNWLNLTNAQSNHAYTAGAGFSAQPTSSTLTISSGFAQSASTYVAYLFATLAGVSKVGSYTGTGTTQVINCGFTAGARFVMIKRTDSTGAWHVWDSARGIVSGNDPYLLLNSTAAEVTSTDYVDTASTGFEISSTAPAAINANGGTFIFLAIA